MIENGVTIKQKEGASGYPITRIETLSNDRFNRGRLGYADIENIEAYTDHILDNEDLIMSHINSRPFLGRTVIYLKRGDEKIIHGMNVLRIKTNRELLNPFYAYYYFKTPHFRKAIDNIRTDAINQSSINTNNIKDITIHIPSITSQNSIVNVLRGIDKKIEINEEVNAELEAMAKQLYDYWFVQFDFPDENGKPYKSSGGKMVYNEIIKREIPKGWDVCALGDFCEMYQPKTIGLNEMTKGGPYRVYGANGRIGYYHTYNHQDSEIIMACRGNSCGVLNRSMPYSWITGNAMVLSIKDKSISNEFLAQSINYMNVKGVITGSGQPQITRENLYPLHTIIPERNILNIFTKRINYIVEKKIQIECQNDYLTHLRDSLLPMLMNGQVTVE